MRRASSDIGERLLDFLSGSGDPALRSREGAAGERRHVLERLAFDVAQRPGDALVRRQSIEDRVDAREQSALLGRRALIDDAVVNDGLVEAEEHAQAPLAEPLSRDT